MNKKYLYILIITIVASAFTIVILNETEKPLPEAAMVTTSKATANWKTYRNEKYGFEFMYPGKLGEVYQRTTERKLECSSDINSSVSLNLAIPNLEVGFVCLDNLNLNDPYKSDSSNQNKMINIDGRVSYYFDYVSVVNYHNKELYIPVTDGIYIYLTHTYKSGHPDYVELSSSDFQKIISSFKFTK